MHRRSLLKAALAIPGLGLPLLSARAQTSAGRVALKAASRSLDINGRAASVYGLLQNDGTQGLRLNAGRNFDVALTNALAEPTLIHWHGLTPPNALDGMPDNPAPLMAPGESRPYLFPAGTGGTHWMHAHTLQEQGLLAAPLIVRTAEDLKADEQEVIMLLHDFSFTPAAELLANLQKAAAAAGAAPNGTDGDDMGMMMDSNDINYDAYLANDRTLNDPDIVKVEKGGKIRLRIINAATATIFTIDTGALQGSLIAVDGQPILPVHDQQFPVAMGQRLDIRLELPKEGGAFPILALRENALERAGIVLATTGAAITKLPVNGTGPGPVVDLTFERKLRAARPLELRKADRRYKVLLTGSMGGMMDHMHMMKGMAGNEDKKPSGYEWSMRTGGPLKVKQGERVEIAMQNMSMMTHPMHLYGHHFQVVSINGEHLDGALRDTVAVAHMTEVVIAFDAVNPGKWAFHCHHFYHMATGMMSFVEYDA